MSVGPSKRDDSAALVLSVLSAWSFVPTPRGSGSVEAKVVLSPASSVEAAVKLSPASIGEAVVWKQWCGNGSGAGAATMVSPANDMGVTGSPADVGRPILSECAGSMALLLLQLL